MTHTAIRTKTIPSRFLGDRLRRLQIISGAVFSLFVLLHLSNIAIAPFGIEPFNEYQRAIRSIYQNPLVEVGFVLGPLLVHVLAGIGLYLLSRRQPGSRSGKRSLRQRAHSWAGVFLLLVIGGHIMAVRGPSFFYGVFPEFHGVAFTLWYFPAYFYPYYFLLAMAGLYHATNGIRIIAIRRGVVISFRSHLLLVLAVGSWLAVSLFALGGNFYDVGDPQDSEFARLAQTLFRLDIRKPW